MPNLRTSCLPLAQVVCHAHRSSASRTECPDAAQVVGRSHRSPGRPHRLSGLSHSLTDERTSGRTRAQRAGTRPQVVCHAHRFPDTRTGRLALRTSSRTRAQIVCHAPGVQFPHSGVIFPPAGVLFQRSGGSCRPHEEAAPRTRRRTAARSVLPRGGAAEQDMETTKVDLRTYRFGSMSFLGEPTSISVLCVPCPDQGEFSSRRIDWSSRSSKSGSSASRKSRLPPAEAKEYARIHESTSPNPVGG
jgi:hypothetical protein